jgi:isopentenyl diphosphate isomerase/L-lactate dehydrogenase-like FMN-dependent dehydrogenase
MDFRTNHEIIVAARRNADGAVWDYLCGGSESETTMRRNRLALDCLALRPRVLCDVSDIDPAVRMLGLPSRLPFFLAPMASLQIVAAEGGAAAAAAADECGLIYMMSGHTEPDLAAIAAATAAPKMYQIYVRGDRNWTEDLLGRVREAGFRALAVTVDTAVYSNRERQMMAGWEPPSRRNPTGRRHLAELNWDTLAEIAAFWGGPLVVKGIGRPEDAVRAVELGAAAIYVSNHGGRQLDQGRGIAATLPPIVEAVAGRAEVWVDGGFVRGTDIVKALALGAGAVGIGKLQAWALAAGGREALVQCIRILEDEVRIAMGLLGVTRAEQLGPQHLAKARPVGPAHEMSAFPLLPRGGRLV